MRRRRSIPATIFSYRFDHAGQFAYFCSLHAHMQGVVVMK
jgi:plastocyanin